MTEKELFTDKKVAFHTLGCKLNFAESSTIGKELLNNGFQTVKPGEKADLCIINTCSVTETADKKDRQAIKQMIGKHPDAYIVVIGCYAQLKPEEISKIEGVDLIIGTQNKFDLPNLLENMEKKKASQIIHTPRKDIDRFFPSCTRGDRTRYWLKVQDGCDNFCSYCTVPIARGKSRNGSIQSTVEQATIAAREGAKEIVISGVNIGDFGKTTGENLLQLIQALDKVEGIERYRISSIEPDLLSEEIIRFTAQSGKFVPHFHIPLQSGCDKILALMKRHYDTQLFREKIELINQLIPDAFIGVDVIVGTNGETEIDFEETVEFIKSLNITQLHVFSYSERANTQALKINGKVSSKEKKRRSDILLHLSEEKRIKFYQSQIGKELSVLWEESKKGDTMHGFSDNYILVEVPNNHEMVNKITKVIPTQFNNDRSALTL